MTSDVQPPLVPETFEATLVSSRLVTPRVKELVFERVDGKPFTFRSGQWVSLVLPLTDEKGERLRRAYSLASVPGPGSRFELIVTRVSEVPADGGAAEGKGQVPADGGAAEGKGQHGVGSTWLHEAKVGTRLEVKGPQGTFHRPADAGPSLFVATGTGVAPFRGMVHDALAAGGQTPLWVLFGVRSPADALYREEFEALAKAHPRLRFLLTLSRPPPGWTGLQGYVQTHVLELWMELATHGQPHAYLCGVKKMLLEVREVLKKQGGAQRQQLHLESYD